MTFKSLALCLAIGCMFLAAATLALTVVGATLLGPSDTPAATATVVRAADDRKRVFDERRERFAARQ